MRRSQTGHFSPDVPQYPQNEHKGSIRKPTDSPAKEGRGTEGKQGLTPSQKQQENRYQTRSHFPLGTVERETE